MLYHGDKDGLVPIKYSEMIYDSLNNNGGNVEFNILYGYGHNDAIEKTYEDGNIINWLSSKRRKHFGYIPKFL